MNPEQMLQHWKDIYGDIYLANIDDNEFVYRLIGYQEYLSLENRGLDTLALDEAICRLCILDPVIEDWEEEIYGGYSSSLGQLIREESLITPREDGSSDLKALIQQESHRVETTFLLQIPLIIKRSFPEYEIEAIQEMDLPQQIDLYTKSIWMLKTFEDITMTFDEPQ